MWKRKSFEHEKEVRALYWNHAGVTPADALAQAPLGHRIGFDLNGSDGEVIVAPTTSDWIFNTVRDLSIRIGLTVPIRRSELLTLWAEPFVPRPTRG
jgi:hypothetical protein